MKRRSEKSRIVLDTILQKAMEFKELRASTGLSKAYLHKILKDLGREGVIERKSVHRKKRKKGEREYKVLIRPSRKMHDPRWSALWGIASARPSSDLDVNDGLKLLTDKVSRSLLKILSIYWKRQGFDYFPLKRTINQVSLLQSLARYHFDAHRVLDMARAVKEEGAPLDDPEAPLQRLFMESSDEPEKTFVEFCKREQQNPNTFPALRVAREWGVEKQLDGLLEWISPLVTPPTVKTKRGIDVEKFLTLVVSPLNYVAFIFRYERGAYVLEHIIPAWSYVLKKQGYIKRRSRAPKKGRGKGKGGRKGK